MKERKRKKKNNSQNPSGFEPTTSWSQGMRCTTVPQLLPGADSFKTNSSQFESPNTLPMLNLNILLVFDLAESRCDVAGCESATIVCQVAKLLSL